MLPILLLHGALGSADQFQSLQKHLPADWRVFALNFPGHGGLPTQQPYSISNFSAAVLHFMDEHDLPQVYIFGYSMGGYVALGLAAQQPERIKKVITLGTKVDWSPEVAAGMGRMFDPEKIEMKVPQFGQMLQQAHAPADWKVVCRQTSAFLRDLGDGHGLQADTFTGIVCPVTIGWGELDNVVTIEESRRVAGQIPLGKFEMLPGCKHPLEQVNTADLTRFLVTEFSV